MTRCTVARGRRPRATVHRVIYSTEGVSFDCCTERYEIVVLLPNSKLTKGSLNIQWVLMLIISAMLMRVGFVMAGAAL